MEKAEPLKAMATETEIKLQITDRKAFERKLKKIGGRTVGTGNGRVHELNTIFDTPEGGLAKHGQLLRIRVVTSGSQKKRSKPNRPKPLPSKTVLLTFKQPLAQAAPQEHGRFKTREETELHVAEAVALTKIFEGLGLRGWFSYEKYRTTWKLGPRASWAKDLLIEVDETPMGTFIELEGPADAIDRAAQLLGFSRKDYLTKNYLTLYVEDCRRKGLTPTNMLFAEPGKQPKR